MVWSKTCPSDGKPRYVRKNGGNLSLTKDKYGHLVDDLPKGWDAPTERGRLVLRYKDG